MARTQATLAYDFNTKLLHAKHKALDTLDHVLDAMKAKDADPRLIAQARMAAHAVLRVPALGVRSDYAREREAQDPIEAVRPQSQPSITPTPLSMLTATPVPAAPSPVPLADETNGKLPKWMRRELKRAGLASLPNLSLESG